MSDCTPVSLCCGAPLEVESSDEGTSFYRCTDCDLAGAESAPADGAEVIPYGGANTIDADVLRELADDMEAGRIESIGMACVFESGQIAHYHDWNPQAVDVWALLGALNYLTHTIRIGIDLDNGDL